MINKIQTAYEQHQKEISQIIEENRNGKVNLAATKILNLIGLKPVDVHKTTFESCSFVIALSDRKTIIEICFVPEMITIDNEPRNPLFL